MRRVLISSVLAGVVTSTLIGGFAAGTVTSAAAEEPGTTTTTSTEAPATSGSVTTAATTAEPRTTYSYGKYGVRNSLDVYTPTAALGRTGADLPTVVLVHGGSWIMGTARTMAAESKQFAKLGYVAISVDYRPATDAAWPAQRNDLRTALKWVRSHADDLNVDKDKIVVLGSSAGAEIAASALTYKHGSDLARGLITLSPPLDKKMVVARADLAKNAARLANVVTQDLLGCTPKKCPAKYEASSPKNRLDKTDPAVLLFTSKKEWVNPQGTYDFHARAKKVGVSSKLVALEGKVHARDYWDKAYPTIKKWIAKRMAA